MIVGTPLLRIRESGKRGNRIVGIDIRLLVSEKSFVGEDEAVKYFSKDE